MKGLILCLAIGLLIVGFSSSSFAGGAVSVQWGNDPKPDCEDGGGKYKKKGGPPPHAPAHGYRAKHQYRYYPSCNVYHDPSRNMYFYMKGDGWAVGASLPTNLQSNLGVSVNLDMDTDKPYQHNAEHLKQYPKEKYKPGKIAKN
jgi:hypothetical protein